MNKWNQSLEVFSGFCHFNHQWWFFLVFLWTNQAWVLSRLIMDLQSHVVLTLNADKAYQKQGFGMLAISCRIPHSLHTIYLYIYKYICTPGKIITMIFSGSGKIGFNHPIGSKIYYLYTALGIYCLGWDHIYIYIIYIYTHNIIIYDGIPTTVRTRKEHILSLLYQADFLREVAIIHPMPYTDTHIYPNMI